MGRSTDPHVSAPQCTRPDAKSAVSIPATGEDVVIRTSVNLRKTSRLCVMLRSVLTDAQLYVPHMSQMEIGKKVNKVESHEREAEDDADPFLTPFACQTKQERK